MIGWVPHVLVGFLDQVAGPEQRRVILAEAGLDGDATQFALSQDVPDPVCRRVIDTACVRLGVTEEQAFALFAPYFLARAKAAFPGFFRGVTDTRAFLLRQPAIHASLAAGLRDPERRSVADKFRVEETETGVRVHYNSSNRLAALYVTVAGELAASFGDQALITFESGGPTDATCTMRVDLLPMQAKTPAEGIKERSAA